MSTQVCWAEYGPLDATLIERDDHEIVVEYIDDDGYRYIIGLYPTKVRNRPRCYPGYQSIDR